MTTMQPNTRPVSIDLHGADGAPVRAASVAQTRGE